MTTVQTACGEVPVSALGRTLSHEHLFINLMAERRGDGLVHDEQLLTTELAVFAQQGGGTIWDLTTAELTPGSTIDSTSSFNASAGQTRNPRAIEGIKRISQATGVHVLLGTGRYRDPYLSNDLIDRLGVDGLAEEMVRDLEEGIPNTPVRAALIGEIGSNGWFVSDTEEKVFRAAARASESTGALIYTHAARWMVGDEQLRILREEGADPSRIVIGHVDTVPSSEYALQLVQQGINVGIDTINSAIPWEVQQRTTTLRTLIDAGYIDQLLLGHDVCTMSQLRAYGGNGFGYVLGGFRDAVVEAGIHSEDYEHILTENPQRLIAR